MGEKKSTEAKTPEFIGNMKDAVSNLDTKSMIVGAVAAVVLTKVLSSIMAKSVK